MGLVLDWKKIVVRRDRIGIWRNREYLGLGREYNQVGIAF